MEINQSPQPAKYEQLSAEKTDSLVDRVLIRIGDIVIQNFAFLVFITVVWGLFIVLFFGGAVLLYTVSQRFIEIATHEQQRQIIQEQHLEYMQVPITDSSKEIIQKPDESEWFLILSDTAEQTSNLYPEELDSELILEDPQPIAAKQKLLSASFNTQELVTAESSWQVSCGNSGFTLNSSYPCLITQIELLPPDAINEDVAASN